MLIIARKEGETLKIMLPEDLDLSTPIGEVFTGPISIKINETYGKKVGLAIDAPKLIKVLREELLSIPA